MIKTSSVDRSSASVDRSSLSKPGVVRSSVTKKIITGVTGLGLFIFVIFHLLGNLLIFKEDPGAFNEYSHTLVSLGWILIGLELGLLVFFLFHIFYGLSVRWTGKQARSVGYYKLESGGKPSRKNLASTTMAITGVIILVFTVLHLRTFKFGPHYTTVVNGVEMRDLHRLVLEVFQNPGYVIWYVIAMVVLGFHLSYGFWSAFQSLGVYHPRLTPVLYAMGYILAIAIAAGYIAIPAWIYFTGGHP